MVLTAEDIMVTIPDPVPPDLTVEQATKIMSRDHRGYVLVGEKNDVKGIVTEWDFVNSIIAAERDPKTVKISEIMSKELISVEPDTPTRKITEIMSKKGVRRILVGKNGKYSGIITSKDIIRIFDDYVENIEVVAGKFGIL
ncbi:CBS domain-containing protein [Caldiplasma sukawensis]